MLRDIFSSQIKRLMKTNGLSQNALAEKSGVSQGQISAYLGKKVEAGLDSVDRIATALGSEPWLLLKPDAADSIPYSRYTKEIEEIRAELEIQHAANIELVRRAVEAEAELESRGAVRARISGPIEAPVAEMGRAEWFPGKEELVGRIITALPSANKTQIYHCLLSLKLVSSDQVIHALSTPHDQDQDQG